MANDAFVTGYLAHLNASIKESKNLADRPMCGFIAVRLMLIVSGAVLPALAAHDSTYVTHVAVAIAILTGIDTHFRWGEEWRHFRKTQLSLERLKRDYEYRAHAIAGGRQLGTAADDGANFDLLYAQVEALLQADSDDFFKFRITEWKNPADA
ncbi:DUF4231 domain-containing protein [Ensifer sp.]|jgi:hypothetical protein|uniref:DUF4231 domain-containing protein n=1 Tax=Ensifer sp. TaxID=1872086 RepID=UPI002E0FAE40|nr:DUF4231 domain-containing protein [Ensifer sp.]